MRFGGFPELKEAFLSGHTDATFILAPLAMKLREDEKGFRGRVLEFLVSSSGRKLWEEEQSEREEGEELDLRPLLSEVGGYL